MSAHPNAGVRTGAQRFRRGLVVGKFSPLHRGHMFLIDSALRACDEVLVISYTKPEFARCDRAARQAWFDELYPQVRSLVLDDAALAAHCARLGLPPRTLPHNDAPADVHRAFCGWLCKTVCGVGVDAVFTSEDYGDGFARHLAAYFGRETGVAPGLQAPVRHVCVDLARAEVTISGTRARAAPHLAWEFLHPAVRASFVDRVCLLGGESSGKTTLARALAARLGTAWAPEVGRERWEQQGGALDYDDMLSIGRGQVAREDALARQARRWLVCDGSALTSLWYSLDGYGRAAPELRALARRRYALTFVCAPDFPFVQDGTRRDAAFRERQHRWYLGRLAAMDMPYTLLRGDPATRLAEACAILDAAA